MNEIYYFSSSHFFFFSVLLSCNTRGHPHSNRSGVSLLPPLFALSARAEWGNERVEAYRGRARRFYWPQKRPSFSPFSLSLRSFKCCGSSSQHRYSGPPQCFRDYRKLSSYLSRLLFFLMHRVPAYNTDRLSLPLPLSFSLLKVCHFVAAEDRT